MAIKTAILHIQQKTAEQIKAEFPQATEKDVQNVIKLRALMNGQRAEVFAINGKYELLCMQDRNIDREVWYLLEQNPECGAYIDDRDGFDRAYDSGEYSADFTYRFSENEIEFVNE